MRMVDVSDVLEETREFNRGLEELLATQPSAHLVPPEETRRARAEGRGILPAPVILPEGRDRHVPGRAGPVRVRVFVPEPVDGVYLHIHGGGWTLGASNHQDPLLWGLAQAAGVAVVSVEYRLAPEHPYPAGPDDCEDVACWLLEHARREFGTERLVVGGESAGAHLSVVTLLRLRDRHGVDVARAFRGANLVFGAYDLTMTPSQVRWGDRNLVLSGPIVAWFYDNFLPGMTMQERRQPDVSPLFADLAGLPPARFSVGTLDMLVDDSLFMEARWRLAGNDTELDVYQDAVHGFTGFPTGVARLAHAAAAGFVRHCLGVRPD